MKRIIKTTTLGSFFLLTPLLLVRSAPFEASVPGLLQITSSPDCGQVAPMRWSDPNTWGGALPSAGLSIDIPACDVIILDVATPPLGLLRIAGTLRADPQKDVAITADSIYVMSGGALEIGTAAQPYTKNAVITLTGARGIHTPRTEDNALDNDGLSRALRVMNGGALRLFGAVPPLLKTKLNAHAPAGARTFTLADTVNWRAGDRIAISITDFHGVGETESLILASNANGKSLTTTTGLLTSRWGVLQYPTDTGMSLTPGVFTPPDPNTPRVLDERAEIINLSRRIVIQGASDSTWQTDGFGAHVMIMGLNSIAQVQGVEFRQVGQRRAMGRYPFHWHMLSWTAADAAGVGGGQFLGFVNSANHFLKDSSIWDSQNRAVTIHGTCGVTVDNVYAFNIRGHAFFMEDGSESKNTIINSVAMKVRNPLQGNHLKLHDQSSSGFWLTNPDNTVTNNSGSDCDGRGLWNSFGAKAFGLSRNSNVAPNFIALKQFDDNVGHSNRAEGLMTDEPVVDEQGTTLTIRYPDQNSPIGSQRFFVRRNQIWKNLYGGYRNRVTVPQYENWTTADNNGEDFQGSTIQGALMQGILFIGSSLNNATPFRDPQRSGVASYHYVLDIVNVTFINFPYVAPVLASNRGYTYGGGAFDSHDLYVFSIALGNKRNTGWKMINSHAGYVAPAPYFDGFPLNGVNAGSFRYYSLPVVWDANGYWTTAGYYIVPNDPYFTYGLSQSIPSPEQANIRFTPDRFFGVQAIQVDVPPNTFGWSGDIPLVTLNCSRLDDNNVEVGKHYIGPPDQANFFSNMRAFSLKNGGRYKITFPDGPMPTTALNAYIDNAYRPDDRVLIGFSWSGNVPVTGRLDAGWDGNFSQAQRINDGTTRLFNPNGTSIASVLADPTGKTIWLDRANNTVWIQVVGGMPYPVSPYSTYVGDSDSALAKQMQIRLWAQ